MHQALLILTVQVVPSMLTRAARGLPHIPGALPFLHQGLTMFMPGGRATQIVRLRPRIRLRTAEVPRQ